ncbi:hypothetical protein D0T50_07305 [Bacteroides sp. 214]|uniref:hypothetical protein n=1 Tax=Bacteroides sp. 214 TaxID=2302935 RepID=UPI0013D0AAC3|nr:hypothetical protein [Bacteroides sp. 214]NDW12694.1 hypothetical protein [Bacteroides sp. 214]
MNKEKQITDYNWVYIYEDTECQYSVKITTLNDIFLFTDIATDKKLKKIIFYRHFSDTISALGYLSVIKKLSKETIQNIIEQKNPQLKDIKELFFKEIELFRRY